MKKSKFKMVAGIAAIAMSFALLAGCNPGDDATATAEEPTPVTPTGDEEVEEEDVVVTLLDTAIDIAWDKGAEVAADKLASAEDNSKFVVTYTSNSETDYHKFKMANIDCSKELYAGKETNITIDRKSTKKDDLHGCSFVTEPSETAATFSYQPTADEWKILKAEGFKIYGHGVKITKIELVTSKNDEVASPSTEKPADTTGGDNAAGQTGGNNSSDSNVIYNGTNVQLALVQNFYNDENHGLFYRKTVSEMGINLTPANGETYTIYMKGTATDYSNLSLMCIGFETDYDWQNSAMEADKDFSKEKLTAGVSVDVTFNGTADGDWYFWFYDKNENRDAPTTTLTLSEFKITKK